jgi:hypothetical protein
MNEEKILKELGFSSSKEFLLHHWDKLSEESKQKLLSAGISPEYLRSSG